MEFSTSLIKHSDISDEELTEICKLKAVRWKYTLNQHKNWMLENIQPDDFHFLLKHNQKPIAYTNLVDVSAAINNENRKVRGIGNVCTSETGKGYGNVLMEQINLILEQNNWEGILLCRDHLVSYYQKFNWKLIDRNYVKADLLKEVNFMIYHNEFDILAFEYNGRNF